MSTVHDQPVATLPAGPEAPYSPWPGGPGGPEYPGGPGYGGGPGKPAGGGFRRRLAVAAGIIALATATTVGLLVGTRTMASPGTKLTNSQIAAKVDPGLVDVTSTLGYRHAVAAGTGMVLTSTGEVLTNNHVIEGATAIRVTDVGNGRTYQATVVGYDQRHDIAVLQLRGASGLTTVDLGDSSAVSVGQQVVALGNAGGRGGTPSVAAGRITGLNRSITATDQAAGTSEQLTGVIRTNAGVQAGDSGGPLVNRAGQVIGINTAASASFQFQSGETQAFAVPVNQAEAIAAQIEAGHPSATVHVGATGFLGVEFLASGAVPPGVPGTPGGSGAAVSGVLAGSPVARAGLAAGDVIVSLAGHRVASPSDVQSVLLLHHPGNRITITWTDQAGQAHTATVTLATGPAG